MDDHETRWVRSRAAAERLERALQRLEGAVAGRSGDLFIAEELRVVRSDYARLDAAAQLVETRLDGVIDYLKTMVGD